MSIQVRRLLSAALAAMLLSVSVFSQSTEFTYQGRLTDGSLAATGSYDFEFSLFDAATAGLQVGATIPVNSVSVNNGVFTVRLDFGDQFSGGDRFIEISVRQSGGPAFTLLAPRQPVSSTPYAVKSLNSENAVNAQRADDADLLGGVDPSEYVLGDDPRMSDERAPTAGSDNYIRNSTSNQAGGNFRIDGTGRAGIIQADTQYDLDGSRIIGITSFHSIFVGQSAGAVNSGLDNSFFGSSAGLRNTSGQRNSFYGFQSGFRNETGSENSFYGYRSGMEATGSQNVAVGVFAGANPGFTSNSNVLVGNSSGLNLKTGGDNTFLGFGAGSSTTDGSENVFVGAIAGASNVTGTRNSVLGSFAGGRGSRNTIAGYQAGQLSIADESSFFGYQSGANNSSGERNSFFGYLSGQQITTGDDSSFFGYFAGQAAKGSANSFFGSGAGANSTNGDNNSYFGYKAGEFSGSSSFPNNNSFFGSEAGQGNRGSENSYFGGRAGSLGDTGNRNSAFGYKAGEGVRAGNDNVFVGHSAGIDARGDFNTIVGVSSGIRPSGQFNSDSNVFVGYGSGTSVSNGGSNTFVGTGAGSQIDTAFENTFVGFSTGASHTFGSNNAYFGSRTGGIGGSENAFVGYSVGAMNTGSDNAFMGNSAGNKNSSGSSNVFFGRAAGFLNETGSNNTALGSNADMTTAALSFATAVGSGAKVSASNTIQLGRDNEDVVRVGKLGSAGSTALCLNTDNEIAACNPLSSDPETLTELRNLIERQERIIEEQRKRLELLISVVCKDNPASTVCGEDSK